MTLMRQGHCYWGNTTVLIPCEEACSLQKAGRSHTFCVLLPYVKIKSLWLLELLYLWLHDSKSFDESKFSCGSLATIFRKQENVFELPQIWLNSQKFVFHLYSQAIYLVLGLIKVWVFTRTLVLCLILIRFLVCICWMNKWNWKSGQG